MQLSRHQQAILMWRRRKRGRDVAINLSSVALVVVKVDLPMMETAKEVRKTYLQLCVVVVEVAM